MAAILPAAAEITMVFWAAEIAVSGLSFYSCSVADAVITAVAMVSLAADAAITDAVITTVVNGLSGLSFFPASAAATMDAANQHFA